MADEQKAAETEKTPLIQSVAVVSEKMPLTGVAPGGRLAAEETSLSGSVAVAGLTEENGCPTGSTPEAVVPGQTATETSTAFKNETSTPAGLTSRTSPSESVHTAAVVLTGESSVTENEAVVGLNEGTPQTETEPLISKETEETPLLSEKESVGDIPAADQASHGPVRRAVIMANEEGKEERLLARLSAETEADTPLGKEHGHLPSVQVASNNVCAFVADQQTVVTEKPLISESVVVGVPEGRMTCDEKRLSERAAPVKLTLESDASLTENVAPESPTEATPLKESEVPVDLTELETSLTESAAPPAGLTEVASLTESAETGEKEDSESDRDDGDLPQLQTIGRYHHRKLDYRLHHHPWSYHYLTHPPQLDGSRRHVDTRRLHIPDHSKPSQREHVRFTVTPVRQSSVNSTGGSGRKHLAVFEIGDDAEPTDTLTQNSITSLLSAKFRDLSKRWKQYGEESPRFRKRLVSKWESMNYDQIDSQLHQEDHAKLKNKSKKKLALTWVSRWVMMFLVGIGTSLLAAGVHIAVELVAHQKFHLIAKYLDKCGDEGCLIKPVAIWCGINLGISLLAAALVTYVQPTAAGSGIPLIKSYLNGVRVPGLLSLRCFIAKTVGVVLSILGGLACGKEGPMAHSGGIMAAGLGKGRIPWFSRDIKLYNVFRTDHEVRDFVAAGAASGVSAAFGAPVGGTLFSVEEAASFWNTELVWRVFFSAMIACFSTNFLLSAFEGHPTELSHPGLVRFNTFPNLTFDLIEIPVFVIMAVIGGLTGALFVVMNYKLTVFRQKYLHRHNWIKVAESGLVSVVSAVAGFLLMFGVRECTTATPNNSHAITTSMFCKEGSMNSMSTMFLTTPEGCLKSLLHDPLESYGVVPLIAFIIVFFLLGVWTYGLSVSSGVFIPSLAIGAAWGRLIGMGVVQLFPDQAKDVGKYALIGAASQLGGILRTTISLTVIIVECTGDISFGLCIMITLMISKWVGDFFTTGLYDMNVEVSGIPLLSWEPPPLSDNVKVSEFMSHPVLLLLPREKVGHVVDILENETFHGFPIVEQDPSSVLQYKGKLRGLILRDQLLTMLQKKAFAPEGKKTSVRVTAQEFNDPYPVTQRVSIKDLDITEEEKHCVLDFRPYMNRTPYIVNPDFSMPRVFRLFRGLGLRHLVVIDEDYQPIGMVTRKDLAKYRAGTKRGMLHMEQLTIESV